MAVFEDDFNRADGALGDPWVNDYASASVSDNAYYAAGYNLSHVSGYSESGAQDMFIVARVPPSGLYSPRIQLKRDGSSTSSYIFEYVLGPTGATCTIIYYYGTGSVGLATDTVGYSSLETVVCRAVYSGGVVTAYVNGEEVCSASHNLLDSYGGYGLGCGANPCYINAFNTLEAPAQTIEVTPDPLYVGAGPVQMTCTGTGTAWTSGVPGSSELTVDHGTITDQWTPDETHIRFTFTPAEYVGTLVFTESEYGATDSVESTLVPPEGGGSGECPFDQDFIDAANRTADADAEAALLTTTDPAWLSPPLNIPGGISYTILLLRGLYGASPPDPESPPSSDASLGMLWQILNGANTPGAGPYSPLTQTPIKLDTEDTLAELRELRTIDDLDLAQVIAQLRGPMGYTHSDLATAIGLLNNQDVLDAIASMRGAGAATLSDTYLQIAQMRTGAFYTLADIVSRIDNINSPDNTGAIAAATAAILGAIGGVALEVAGVGATATADLAADTGQVASLAALAAEVAGAVASILGAIQALRDLFAQNVQVRVPPVWPGQAHVTFGQAYDLATVVNIDGPMHGVRVSIDSCEPNTSYFRYDDVTAWRHLGGLAFYTDMGDLEPFQALGMAKALYVPKTMAVASGVKLYKSRLPHGTVTPWTITS